MTSPMTTAPPPILPHQTPTKKTWTVGTLSYDRRGLITVFAWLLWGDFCLYLMDAGVGLNLVPLQLKKHGASNLLIGIVTGTLFSFMAVILCPIVSTWSDRYRSRLGRRIPFMLFATPPLALFLTLIGFSPAMANWLKSISPHLLTGISAGGLTVALITMMFVCYKFFDIFPQSVYYYVWADVIPPQLMGTFACLFRVCSTLGVLVFNRYLLRYCDDHPAAICLGAAGLYTVSFLMLCWQVKEGDYPAPEPAPPGPPVSRAMQSVLRFFRECFTHSFYWKYYLLNLCFVGGFMSFRDFLIFYGQQDVKMNLADYGRLMSLRDGVQILIFLCLGPIVDRLHPLRAGLGGLVMVFVAALCSFFFIRSPGSFSFWVIIIFATVAIFQGATGALGPRLLPRTHYGQFCAASALVFHFGQMLLKPVLGALMDHFGNVALFPWFFSFAGMGIVFMVLVYRDWKRLGGDESYVPPLATISREERAFEVIVKH
jgi:maltose/moltooligosaccharide transporter